MDIFEALERGDARRALAIIKRSPSVLRKTTPKGSTVLMAAANYGVGQVVAELVKRGVDVGARRRDGLTAIQCAARTGHRAVLAQLLAAGGKPDAKALTMAKQGQHAACVKLLLGAGDPAAALRDAIATGSLPAIRRLLKRTGASDPRTLTLAIDAGRPEVVSLLLEAGAKPSRTTTAFLRQHDGVEVLMPKDTRVLLARRGVPTRHLALGDGRALVYRGDTRWRSLRLDHGDQVDGRGPQIMAGVIVDGDLRIAGALHNGEQDFGPFLVVLGDLDVDNVALGGATLYVAGDLTVRGAFHGFYNHGLTVVTGELDAKLLLADDYSLELRGAVRGTIVSRLGHVRSKAKLPPSPKLADVVAPRYLRQGGTALHSTAIYEALVAGRRLH